MQPDPRLGLTERERAAAVDEETYRRMRGLVVAELLMVVMLCLEGLAVAWLIL